MSLEQPKKSLNILVIMDPIEQVNYKKDTSLAMMWSAQDRGHRLGYCQIHDLWLDRGQLMVDTQSVTVKRDPEDFYTLGDKTTGSVSDYDVITAGTAMREVVEILEQAGAQVAGIIVALDRKEKGLAEHSAIQELAATLNVPVCALVDIDDLISYLAESNNPNKDATQLAKMQHYRTQYGV